MRTMNYSDLVMGSYLTKDYEKNLGLLRLRSKSLVTAMKMARHWRRLRLRDLLKRLAIQMRLWKNWAIWKQTGL